MIWASRRGAADVVKCLLENDADPNIVGANGYSSLIHAVKGGHEACVKLLLSASKINVNQSDRDGRTAISYAAKQGSASLVSMLVEKGAYLNLAERNGDTPLIKAVKHGSLDTVKVLLNHFADTNIKGKVMLNKESKKKDLTNKTLKH